MSHAARAKVGALRVRPAGAVVAHAAAVEVQPARAAPKAGAGAKSGLTQVAETTGRVAAKLTNVFDSLTGAIKRPRKR